MSNPLPLVRVFTSQILNPLLKILAPPLNMDTTIVEFRVKHIHINIEKTQDIQHNICLG